MEALDLKAIQWEVEQATDLAVGKFCIRRCWPMI